MAKKRADGDGQGMAKAGGGVQDADIGDFKQDAHNFNKGRDEGQRLIEKSFSELGAGRSILVDRNNNIIAGNKSQKAAIKAGIKRVRVIETDGTELIAVRRTDVDIDSEEGRKLALADNSTTAANLDWDIPEMESELDRWGIDAEEWGVPDFGDREVESVEGEDDAPEVNTDEPPDSERGAVYILGAHRLMCGDSTSSEDVARLMNGERADLVFTDPPYGMKKESEGVLNDNLNFDDLLEFNKRWIPLTFANLKANGSWYCWGIDEPLMDIYANILKPMIKSNEITFRNLITWDKNTGLGQRSEECRMYPIADEKCLFVMKGVQGYNNNSDHYFEGWEPIRSYLQEEAAKVGITSNKQLIDVCGCGMYAHWFTKSQWQFITEEHYKELQKYAEGRAFNRDYGAFKRDYEELKRDYEELKRDYYATRAYFDNGHDNMNNVWHFDRTSKEEREGIDHATPKPIALCARGIKTSSREGETVLDVFGGSGSTMIACEKLGRKCRMMELDEHYCDVIRRRWAEFVHGEGCDWMALTPRIEG